MVRCASCIALMVHPASWFFSGGHPERGPNQQWGCQPIAHITWPARAAALQSPFCHSFFATEKAALQSGPIGGILMPLWMGRVPTARNQLRPHKRETREGVGEQHAAQRAWKEEADFGTSWRPEGRPKPLVDQGAVLRGVARRARQPCTLSLRRLPPAPCSPLRSVPLPNSSPRGKDFRSRPAGTS